MIRFLFYLILMRQCVLILKKILKWYVFFKKLWKLYCKLYKIYKLDKLDGWNGSRLNYDWKCFNDSIRDAVIRWEDLIDNYCWGMMAKFHWWSKYISLLTSYRRKNCIMHFPYKDEIHDAITSTRYKLVRSLSVLDNSREKYILYFSF